MALGKYKYRPYYSRKRSIRRRRFFGVLILIVIIILIVLSFKSCGKDEIPNTTQQPPAAVSDEVAQTVRNITATPGKEQPKPIEKVEPPQPKQKPEVQTVKPEVPKEPKIEIADEKTTEQLREIEQTVKKHLDNKEYIAARDLLNKTLLLPLTASQREDIKNTMTSLSKIWLFSNTVLADDTLCSYYKIGPGQSLSTIGNKFNVPTDFLAMINKIPDKNKIRAGQKIKVVQGPFNAIIYRSTFVMDVYLQDTYVKSYMVGLGKVGEGGNPTPTGKWRVKSAKVGGKLIRPPWPHPVSGKLIYHEDPDYPLGDRWIGLDGIEGQALGKTGFGIHGTNEPDSVGKYSSEGCIRLKNEEVIEFYKMVMTGLTEVMVVD